MSTRRRKASDVVITDFENEHIFVIHTNTRRDSNQSTQTLETEIDGSCQSISNNPAPDLDIELGLVQTDTATVLVRRKSRRDSNQSAPTIETQFRGTDQNVRIVNNPTPDLDLDIDNVQDREGCNRNFSCRAAVTRHLSQIKSYSKDEETFNWTIIQTWYNIQFLQCAVPFYIRRNIVTKEYEAASFRLQQVN